MKPIIIDMQSMSDSTELYDSKPNRFLVYTIYLILIILSAAILWMYFFKMDVVVKSNGIFRSTTGLYEVSSAVTGTLQEIKAENGQYVTEGTVLYTVSVDDLDEMLLYYENELETQSSRLEALNAYEESLNGDPAALETVSGNEYYEEFANRRALLFANLELNESDNSGQIVLYQGSINSISGTIDKYEEKIEKLNTALNCVVSRENTFDNTEQIYYSTISSYLASYNLAALQYDNQIAEYQRQIEEYERQIDEAEDSDYDEEVIEEQVEAINRQKDGVQALQDASKKEKEQTLTNLELQQVSALEQQISGYDDTIVSLENNLTSARLQLSNINNIDYAAEENAAILAEKANLSAEILACKDSIAEYEYYLTGYRLQKENCTIKAGSSGYYYYAADQWQGTYVQEGSELGTIYPEEDGLYYAEIYVENQDIGLVELGQAVKFEIAAYPSEEYGYFTGTVEAIAPDISVDNSTGSVYYIVKVKCDNIILKGEDGTDATLINGMACQAKIVVDEKSVLTLFLEKIDLLD